MQYLILLLEELHFYPNPRGVIKQLGKSSHGVSMRDWLQFELLNFMKLISNKMFKNIFLITYVLDEF